MRYTLVALACVVGAGLCASTNEPQARLYKQTLSELYDGRVSEAFIHAQAGYNTAVHEKDSKYQVAFLLMLGNVKQIRSEYREALSNLERGLTLASAIGLREAAATAAGALANLYLKLGERELAYARAASALALLPADASPSARSQCLLAVAGIRWKASEFTEASSLFLQAIDEADRDPNPATLASAWSMYGVSLLEAGKLDAAEIALTESFRLRVLYKKGGLDVSYRNLGMLRLGQGDAKSAVTLLDRAIGMYEAGNSRLPGWTLYFRRGQARRAVGDLDGAFADLGHSVELARAWRAGVLPADEVQTQTDIDLDHVYDAYVSAGMQMWKRRHDPSLAERMFVAVEENRAASLRRDRSWRTNLPSEYWEVLAQDRRLEIAALTDRPGAGHVDLTRVRARLSELESSAGLISQEKAERISPGQALSVFRTNLQSGDAFVSFQIGDSESFAWVLTSTHLKVSCLAGRQAIGEALRRLNGDIVSGQDLNASASGLYSMLFTGFGPALDRSPDWILSLDDELFDVPFAALRVNGQFLVDRHSLRAVPTAFLLDSVRGGAPPGSLLAVGDPIYNSADSRWRAPTAPAVPGEPLPRSVRQLLELPRLPASAREVSEVARVWRAGAAVTLTGRDVNRARIDGELNSHPSAVHFAIHVVPAAPGSDRALMAVGLDQSGRPDFYTPEELAAKRLDIPLIVLSACRSGRGGVLPGAGRMGLTRAWLISGSRTVVASYWPTPDDSGAMFSAMYRDLNRSPGPLSTRRAARSLRNAQTEMMHSASWRAQPLYWAAYFLVGRD